MTSDLRRGSHHVTCRHCGQRGVVVLGRVTRGGTTVEVEDRIDHAEDCPSYRRPQPRHLQRKAWRAQERRANELVGAHATPASGSLGRDGDGRAFHRWRVESKGTIHPTYRLKQDIWTKLVRGALLAGEEPVLHVLVMRGKPAQQAFVVVRRELYDALCEDEPRGVHFRGKSFPFFLNSRPPLLVDLEPTGVALTEAGFEKLKEKLK